MKLIILVALIATSYAAPSLLGGHAHAHVNTEEAQGYTYGVPEGDAFSAAGDVRSSPIGEEPVAHHEEAHLHHEEAPAVHLDEEEAFAVAAEVHAPVEVIGVVRDDREPLNENGEYSFDTEGEDGTVRQEEGSVSNGGVHQTGSWSFTLPDGQVFEMTFVADENGFQPQSNFLPAMPDFVLEQIEYAKNHPESEEPAAHEAVVDVVHHDESALRTDLAPAVPALYGTPVER